MDMRTERARSARAEMTASRHGIRGRLAIAETVGGVCHVHRRAANMVLRQGAVAVASLFAGAAAARPITALRVGFGEGTVDPETTALTPPEGTIPPEALQTAIDPAAFSLHTDLPNVVQIAIAAPFRPSVDLPLVSEAGLIAGETLYNHVSFEPLDLEAGREITFFWEIDFPFGD